MKPMMTPTAKETEMLAGGHIPHTAQGQRGDERAGYHLLPPIMAPILTTVGVEVSGQVPEHGTTADNQSRSRRGGAAPSAGAASEGGAHTLVDVGGLAEAAMVRRRRHCVGRVLARLAGIAGIGRRGGEGGSVRSSRLYDKMEIGEAWGRVGR